MTVFSEEEITNLISLCRYQSSMSGFNIDCTWEKLIAVLLEIKNNNAHANVLISQMINDVTNREDYINILIKLFNLGMYMRGWDGITSYPIGLCYVSDEDRKHVEEISWLKLMEFKELLNSNNGIVIGKLHLYDYNLQLGQYEESDDPNIGITIADRIFITEKADDTFGCIRVASNYIIPTACFYLELLKVTDIYNIKNVSYIN